MGRGETAQSGRDFPSGWRSPSPGSSCCRPAAAARTLARSQVGARLDTGTGCRAGAGLGWVRAPSAPRRALALAARPAEARRGGLRGRALRLLPDPGGGAGSAPRTQPGALQVPRFRSLIFTSLPPFPPSPFFLSSSRRPGGCVPRGEPPSGPAWSRAGEALAAFDVAFECRSLAPLLAPSICGAGGGTKAFKGALPAAAAPLRSRCRAGPPHESAALRGSEPRQRGGRLRSVRDIRRRCHGAAPAVREELWTEPLFLHRTASRCLAGAGSALVALFLLFLLFFVFFYAIRLLRCFCSIAFCSLELMIAL